MAIPEMEKAISRLRLLLATVNGKEEELDSSRRQFRRQLGRAPGYEIQRGESLDATLGIMEEIQERLDKVEETRAHLASIKKRAQDELRALSLTGKIERAKTELASLSTCLNSCGNGDYAQREKILELERVHTGSEHPRGAGDHWGARRGEGCR